MKRTLTIVLTLLCFAATAADKAKDIPFNGLILDNYGKGVKVRITVKGTDKRTASDREGKFGFTNLKDGDTLVFRYSKKTVEIPVSGKQSAKIVLLTPENPSVSEDEDLRSMGFSYVERREFPTNSGGLTAEVIESSGFTNLVDAMRARCAGVEVFDDGTAIIRGANSVESVAKALILCDGMEISSLNSVNVHDVKSVEIQKDGTMYGFRGVNGVVQIKTKSGNRQ